MPSLPSCHLLAILDRSLVLATLPVVIRREVGDVCEKLFPQDLEFLLAHEENGVLLVQQSACFALHSQRLLELALIDAFLAKYAGHHHELPPQQIMWSGHPLAVNARVQQTLYQRDILIKLRLLLQLPQFSAETMVARHSLHPGHWVAATWGLVAQRAP